MTSFVEENRAGRWLDVATVAGLFAALFVAFYVGFRLPSLWSLNYYIPGFFDGFYRRGLLGTLLYPLGALRFDYVFVACLQGLILLALVGLLVVHALRSGPGVRLLAIAYLVAPTGGYLFHDIGYVDQVLYLTLLASLAIEDKRFSLLLLIASLFVQEIAIFTTIPLYLAGLVAGRRYGLAIGQGMILLAVFVLIYLFFQTVPPATIDAFLAQVREHADYPLRLDYYEVFKNEFTGRRMTNYYSRASFPQVVFALPIALLAGAAHLRADRSLPAVLAALATFAACAAPLLLGFVGWDLDRWVFLSMSSSVLALLLYKGRVAPALIAAVAGLLLLFGIRGLSYFDPYQPRPILPYPHVARFFEQELPQEVGRRPSL